LQIIHHNRRYTPVSLKTHTANELSTMIRSARSSMKSFTGDFFGSEIFLHESLLYVDFVWQLRQRGIPVVQVYDGFYLPYGSISEDEIEELMCQCTMNYLDDFKCWRTSTNAEVIT